jgi:acyl-CoA synthetase (AMP-forming)/AMP-acid ligase II
LTALAAAPVDRTFVTMWSDETETSVTFGEFLDRSRAQAVTFRSHGLLKGDTVILILPQGIDLMTAFVGAMVLGAIPTILAYPNFKVEPNKYRFGLAGVTKNLGAKLIVLDVNFPSEFLGYVDTGAGAKVVRSAEASTSPETELPAPDINPDTVAFIQHSAGTTGLQKGVALSHAAVLRQLGHLCDAIRVSPEDRVYSWLPLYHDMGLIACFMLPLVYHLPIVMQSPTEWVLQPGTMLQLITKYRCTLAWIPNFTLQFLARRVHPDDRDEFELSSLRAMINCSEPVRGQSMDEFTAVYKDRGLKSTALQSSYAMAENVFAVTQSDVTSAPKRVNADAERLRTDHCVEDIRGGGPKTMPFISSGRVLPENEVRIVMPETGEILAGGYVGEVIIRSDSLFTGYFNRPDLTAEAVKDGWYWTGDLGFLLDGELFVIGRKKDLIIVAGKNIYPQDVEEIVFAHPAIHDGRAVAVGLLNPDLGTEDIIVVAEVDDEKDLAPDAAMAIERDVRGAIVAELGVAARAVYLKPPRWLVKSTAGKPARGATRDKLLAEHPELAQQPSASQPR